MNVVRRMWRKAEDGGSVCRGGALALLAPSPRRRYPVREIHCIREHTSIVDGRGVHVVLVVEKSNTSRL
jgi:hypothetical protein